MELLEVLRVSVGCDYISDLPLRRELRSNIKSSVMRLNADDYPLKEWNDAVSYLTKMNAAAATCSEAKNIIIANL